MTRFFKAGFFGRRKALREIEALRKRYPSAAAAAIYEKGHAIDADAVPLTPIELSPLRKSHYVSPPTNIRNPVVEVGFGTDYALPVHEREDLRHTPPTRAKFLEAALQMHEPGYLRWIADRTRSNAKRRRGIKSIPARAPKRPVDTSDDGGQT